MINPNPECTRDDCRFSQSPTITTCVYYTPVYDKNGVNTNPDKNMSQFNMECHTCGKIWIGKTCVDKTTYTKI